MIAVLPTVDFQDIRDRYIAAQLAGDWHEALRIVMEDAWRAGVPVATIYSDVLQATQMEIGRRWRSNRITVTQEHVATAISQIVVSNLYTLIERAAPNGRRIIVACAEGERHELGARMAADFLEMAGFSVIFLGADVPASDLVEFALRQPVDLVVLSCTTAHCFPGLRMAIEHLRESVDADIPIAVGGAAFSEHQRCTIPGVFDAGDCAADVVAAALRITKVGCVM